jgi:leucyl/phenylalanyl-tRNA---protein transferase
MFDLLTAYANAIFPMGDPDTGEIHWYSPDPRGIIPLNQFHVPKNLHRVVRQSKFDIRSDTAFEQVMRHCAKPRSATNGSWMTEELLQQYLVLHENGYAHSVEAWRDDRLVGGLYGVQLGGAFFGESMFSLPAIGGSNASKVCLVHLVRWLKRQGFTLLDTQFANEHLLRFGCVEIPRTEYVKRLRDAVARDVTWGGVEA